MKTVTTIHLNGRAYQVEEEAHGALAAYLDKAATTLADNPDKDEIMADFEAAIAEKFSKYLTPNKNVITHKEIEEIIAEMGPVGDTGGSGTEAGGTATAETKQKSGSNGAKKRLYRIREGRIIAGVCSGLAAYFNVDVVIVRVIFVFVGIISHGGAILAYIILMLVMPQASEGEARAHASAAPLSAHDFIEQAKKNYAEYKTDGKEWKRRWQKEKQAWKYKEREARLEHIRRMREQENPWRDTAIGIIWLALVIGAFVAAYRHVPFFHYNFDRLGHWMTLKMSRTGQ